MYKNKKIKINEIITNLMHLKKLIFFLNHLIILYEKEYFPIKERKHPIEIGRYRKRLTNVCQKLKLYSKNK